MTYSADWTRWDALRFWLAKFKPANVRAAWLRWRCPHEFRLLKMDGIAVVRAMDAEEFEIRFVCSRRLGKWGDVLCGERHVYRMTPAEHRVLTECHICADRVRLWGAS